MFIKKKDCVRASTLSATAHGSVLGSTLILFFLFCAQSSQAQTGSARVESSGFLKESPDRGSGSVTLSVGPDIEREGKIISSKLDLQAISFLSDTSSVTAEAKNAYISTSWALMPHHQVTLGRRVYDWSKADNQWKMGLWSPRFLWDPLRPETVGLTGAFYQYQSNAWKILAFASPVSIPERGFPIRQEKGQLVSSSPDWVPPFNQMLVMKQKIDIHYQIAYPSNEKLILNPGAAVQLKYGKNQGPQAALIYGYKPIHQVDIALEAGLKPQESVLDATLHPRVLFHHILTGEVGYKLKDASVWFSATGESPEGAQTPTNWVTNRVGPALITSFGSDLDLGDGFSLSGSYLDIQENQPAPKEGDFQINFPSRFPYRRATQLSAQYDGMKHLTYDLGWKYDIENASHLISTDVTYATFRKDWKLGFGVDLFASTTSRGLIGQYYGNDRVRGSISYAF